MTFTRLQMSNIIDFKFVPWGNGQIKKDGSPVNTTSGMSSLLSQLVVDGDEGKNVAKSVDFFCQHGGAECAGNVYESCTQVSQFVANLNFACFSRSDSRLLVCSTCTPTHRSRSLSSIASNRAPAPKERRRASTAMEIPQVQCPNVSACSCAACSSSSAACVHEGVSCTPSTPSPSTTPTAPPPILLLCPAAAAADFPRLCSLPVRPFLLGPGGAAARRELKGDCGGGGAGAQRWLPPASASLATAWTRTRSATA